VKYLAERLLDEMINKINQITASLDGTIAQINQMSTAIQSMSQKFSEETISVNENIRLIVEVLKQFRMKSGENLQEIADDFNAKLKELYEKKSIESITEQEKKAIEIIKQAEQVVSNNLYYAQLLNIIQSIREETNRIISCKE
jgi:predicted RNA-binding protein Jag